MDCLEVIELTRPVGGYPAGTVGTVVDVREDGPYLVELAASGVGRPGVLIDVDEHSLRLRPPAAAA